MGDRYYYCEVLPIAEQKLTIHLMTGTHDEPESLEIVASELTGYVAKPNAGPMQGREIEFQPDVIQKEGTDGGCSTFTAVLPEHLAGADKLQVLVPKIIIEDQRLSFGFTTALGQLAAGPEAADGLESP